MRIYEDGIYRDMTEEEENELLESEQNSQLSSEERIEQLEKQNKELSAMLNASIEANSDLEECLIEMAEIVYQ